MRVWKRVFWKLTGKEPDYGLPVSVPPKAIDAVYVTKHEIESQRSHILALMRTSPVTISNVGLNFFRKMETPEDIEQALNDLSVLAETLKNS